MGFHAPWRARARRMNEFSSVPTRARQPKGLLTMAKLTNEEIIDALKEMTLLEASELVKMIEDTFGVSAAAPAAVVAGPAAGAAPAEEARGLRRQQDPGHQGRPRAHQPWPQGGQGGRRERPEGRSRGCQEGGRRRRQGEARGCRRCRLHQVVLRGRIACLNVPRNAVGLRATNGVQGVPGPRFLLGGRGACHAGCSP